MYNDEQPIFITIALFTGLFIGVLAGWISRDNLVNKYICEQVYQNDVQTYKKCMKETPYQNLQKIKLERDKHKTIQGGTNVHK